MNTKFIVIICALYLSFCTGCFHWQGHNGSYHVEIDLAPESIIYPAAATYILTPQPFNIVVGAGTYLGLGLALLPISVATLPFQYPFLPGKTQLQQKIENTDTSQQKLEIETREIIMDNNGTK